MSSGRSADVPLSAYGVFVRRHARLIGATMLIGLLGGLAVGHRLATYVGDASVVVAPLDLGPQGVPGQVATPILEKDAVTPDTEAQIATSLPVLRAVRTATGLHSSFSTLASHLSIDAPTNTRVLTLSFEARSARVARAGAQAAAEAFLVERAKLITSRSGADIASLDAQLAAVGADFDKATDSTERAAITEKIRSLRRTKSRLQTTLAAPGTLLRPATESALHLRLGREVPATSGLLLGLLAGIGLAKLRRTQLVTAWDVRRALRTDPALDVSPIPLQARTVRVRRGRHGRSGFDPAADKALRKLGNVVSAAGGGVSMLTGPARPEAMARLASGLSDVLGRSGTSVALVLDDSDERVVSGAGISRSAVMAVQSSAAAQGLLRDDAGGVVAYRLTLGPNASNDIVTLRRAHSHVIVLATGEPDADVCALARTVDRVFVVAEKRRTPVEDFLTVVRRLRLVHAPVETSVLIGAAR